jgi:hypothetical protein
MDHVADHGENPSPVAGHQRVVGTEVPLLRELYQPEIIVRIVQ